MFTRAYLRCYRAATGFLIQQKSERVRSTFDEHSLLGRLFLCLFHCLNDLGMDPLSGGHDTKVLPQSPALTKIERLSSSIADNTASFLDEQRTRGMILQQSVRKFVYIM